MTKNDLDHHVRIAQSILRALDCPRSLAISMMLENGMWGEIANLKINPLDYNDHAIFFRDYQATKLLSKADWLPTGIDKRAVAKEKFLEAEESCRLTNLRWGLYRQMKLKFQPDYEQIFHSARRKIGKVLGDQLYRWTTLCDFGPGADGSTVRGMTSAYNKLSNPGCITGGALPYLAVFCSLTRLNTQFVWDTSTKLPSLSVVRGNKVTFVPKSAKTDRPIAVEPRWNMWMQKGFGKFLRTRLKLFGVDLDFQGLNQALAIYGSGTGKYATIDLASASDTISSEMVRAMLPEPWLTILDALRSPQYHLDGEWRTYEKWSSMGNGYTFELESLIFWALCSSITDDVSVYGDDIIIPTQFYDTALEVLSLCGFSPNRDKSFKEGYFRESCGTDAFNGENVTPIYWKNRLDDDGTLRLVNQISSLASKLNGGGSRSLSLKSVWKDLVYSLPKRFQQRGPSSLSTVIHDCESRWSSVRKFGWDGQFITVWLPIPRRFRFTNFDAALLSQYFQPSSDGYIVRDKYSWKKRTVFVPRSYGDIGPWE